MSECVRFFTRESLDALRRSAARVESGEVIAARKDVVTSLRDLNKEYLRPALRKLDLHPHPNPLYTTNVFFPKEEANGRWVDYIRMGYGKERRLVQEMARRSGINSQIASYGGVTDAIPFHYVAQVQIGAVADYWFYNFYVDDKAWLEVDNLLNKVREQRQRQICVDLLNDLYAEGYTLGMWYHEARETRVECEEAEEFLTVLGALRGRGVAVNVDIYQRREFDDPENCVDRIGPATLREFERMLKLYRFWAWHPQGNHHIAI